MKKQIIAWNPAAVKDPQIRKLLSTLGEHYPLVANGKGLELTPILGKKGLRVRRANGRAEVTAGTISQLARGVGMLLSGTVGKNRTVTEKTVFQTAGLMLDCCRNSVLKVDYVKEWLRRAALMGYNLMMLYTKDTYELPGEECFGYLRGRYAAAELKEIDEYAGRLGIEMVGCIQALGHLEPVLRWPRYRAITDTAAELLTTEEKSYELINKMLDFYGSVFKSRRIHLGMDETHGLGRGRYMDLNGYRRPFDIYIDHLNRVVGECNKRKLTPMIWSDMFFRMGSKTMAYYDTKAVTPQDIIDKIPREVQLTYWDYFHKDKEFYREWIQRHRKLGSLPVMASGIWTWPVFWYNHRQTVQTVRPCIEACIQEGVEEIIFTMWGDDGGYCDWSSALAGACYAAEKIFASGEPGDKLLEKKFAAICGGSYRAHVIAAEITQDTEKDKVSATAVLWDDPLLGIYRKDQEVNFGPGFWHRIAKHYRGLETALRKYPDGGAGSIRNIRGLIALLQSKIQANLAVAGAYGTRNKKQLASARKLIAKTIRATADFEKSCRKLWYVRNKTFGYEVMQIRLAGQAARWRELDQRLQDLADEKIDSIPELEEKTVERVGINSTYHFLATASVYF
ncbi:MAG: beta-N-acetylhexosaminidase [Kiritimatiellae bacterium]|nr:beta-N-acetylhexosaminidase [Kiritimatiellia bacterium]